MSVKEPVSHKTVILNLRDYPNLIYTHAETMKFHNSERIHRAQTSVVFELIADIDLETFLIDRVSLAPIVPVVTK